MDGPFLFGKKVVLPVYEYFLSGKGTNILVRGVE